jgi:hypothetical protein
MAYAFVGQAGAVQSGTNTTVTVSYTPTAGNHLIVLLESQGGAPTTLVPSDTVNSYVQCGSTFTDGGGGAFSYALWEANNVAGTALTVTGTVTGSNRYMRGIYVREDSGLANPAYISGTFTPLQVLAPGTGGSSISTGNITVNTVPSALVGLCVNEGSTLAPTYNTPFTPRTAVDFGGSRVVVSEDIRLTSTSTAPVVYGPGSGGGGLNYFVMGAAFLESGNPLSVPVFTLYGLQALFAQ